MILDFDMSKKVPKIQCLWAKNIVIYPIYDAGIPVPRPLYITKNVLWILWVKMGLLVVSTDTEIEQNDYDQAISIIRDLYRKAKLVHGDFSEYNIFKTDDDSSI